MLLASLLTTMSIANDVGIAANQDAKKNAKC
jgi:hypothetical protein